MGKRRPVLFAVLLLVVVSTLRPFNELVIRGTSLSLPAERNYAVRPYFRLTKNADECSGMSGRNLLVLSWNLQKWIRLLGLITVADDYSDRCLGVSLRKNTCTFVHDVINYEHADAVLFHGDLTSPRDLPPRLSRRQKWIFFTRETPRHTIFDGGRFSRLIRQVAFYNLTSTYSLTSDIPQPYSDEVCFTEHPGDSLSKTKDTFPTKETGNKDYELSELRSIIKKKNRLVAWFVSHCKTSSRRENYVNELRRHITIDIFGKCGTHQCPFNVHADQPFADCDNRLLNTTYKFYLSFENSLCDDYITEKFFRLRHLDIIPVVLGAGDYSRWMPSGTFVDVRHFRSPRELANFLIRLDNDDEAYLKLLSAKRRMICRPLYERVESYSDRLCRYLHQHYDIDQRTDLRSIIDPRLTCVKPDDFYRNISTLRFL